MSKVIDVFDRGEYLGKLEGKLELKEGALMQILNVSVNSEPRHVLHCLDMDYGILLEDKIAKRLLSAIDDVEEEV